jgi:hypothetical protein
MVDYSPCRAAPAIPPKNHFAAGYFKHGNGLRNTASYDRLIILGVVVEKLDQVCSVELTLDVQPLLFDIAGGARGERPQSDEGFSVDFAIQLTQWSLWNHVEFERDCFTHRIHLQPCWSATAYYYKSGVFVAQYS